MIVGYARASSADQSLDIQLEALSSAGASKTFSEKLSGTKASNRQELHRAIEFVREGDTLLITRLDRLARSVADLETIVATLKAKGVHLKATQQPIDTSTPAGVAFLQMLGVFAQFETAIRKERQLEGIAKAKEEGVYRGRKATIDTDRIRSMKAEGQTPTDIAKALGIHRASVYRALEA